MKNLIPTLLLLLTFAGCRRGDPSWETGIAVPIAHGSFGIEQLIPDSLTSIDGSGLVSIDYTYSFNNLGTDTLFEIPDTSLNYAYFLPINYQLAPGAQLVNQTSTTRYQLGAIQLVNATLRKGEMRMAVQNDLTQPVDFRFQLPYATRNGFPLDTTLYLPAAPDSLHGYRTTAIIDLSGYSIDLRGPAFNQVNTLTTKYIANISPSAPGYENLFPADSVVMNITFTGLVPEYVRGYFGNQTLQAGPEETFTDALSRFTSGSIGLEALTMELEIENYIGMDARMQMNSLWSRNSRTGQTVPLTAPIIGMPINFNRATYSWGTPPSVPERFTYTLNNSNSNIRALVENLPDHLGYNIGIVTNPLGNVSGSNDFFYTDWGINAKLHLLMPLAFHANQLTMVDTLAVDLTALENPNAVGSGELTVYADNGFPFEARLQVFMLDASGAITDSIISAPGLIAQAPLVNASSTSLMAAGSTASVVRMPLTAAQSQRLLASQRVLVRVVMDTNSAPNHIRIQATDRLDVRITADFNYTFGN